jgi:hypothetical protein
LRMGRPNFGGGVDLIVILRYEWVRWDGDELWRGIDTVVILGFTKVGFHHDSVVEE